MAVLDNIKRLLKEDYKKEYQDLIATLASTLNPFMEQVTLAFDGDIDFNNLKMETLKVTVKVDASGTPIIGDKIKITNKNRISGVICINARNLDNYTNYPSGTPFLSTTISNQIITVNNITNLTANQKYEITLLIIPS